MSWFQNTNIGNEIYRFETFFTIFGIYWRNLILILTTHILLGLCFFNGPGLALAYCASYILNSPMHLIHIPQTEDTLKDKHNHKYVWGGFYWSKVGHYCTNWPFLGFCCLCNEVSFEKWMVHVPNQSSSKIYNGVYLSKTNGQKQTPGFNTVVKISHQW